MIAKLRWRRVARGSGPGNILCVLGPDGWAPRYAVLRGITGDNWIVRDMHGKPIPGPGTSAPYAARSMKLARSYAEQYAREH